MATASRPRRTSFPALGPVTAPALPRSTGRKAPTAAPAPPPAPEPAPVPVHEQLAAEAERLAAAYDTRQSAIAPFVAHALRRLASDIRITSAGDLPEMLDHLEILSHDSDQALMAQGASLASCPYCNAQL